MPVTSIRQLAAAFVAAFSLQATTAVAQTYIFKTVKFGGLSQTNTARTSVGGYGGPNACFLNHGKTNTPLMNPLNGTSNTVCYGINKSGSVVGYYLRGYNVGYIYKDGAFTDVLPRHEAQSELFAISDKGVIAGESNGQAFTTADGKHFHTITVPGANGAFAMGINNAGQVVLQAFVGLTVQTFLMTKGVFQELVYPGAVQTSGYQINNHGQVALTWYDGKLDHGAVYDSASNTYIPIDVPNATGGSGVEGIDDAQTVVGYYIDGHKAGGFIAYGKLFN